jgi:L-2-hydroxyglutarate oxidase LhgO
MEAHIEKLVFGGQAMGKTPDGKLGFIWGALPGETVEVEVLKNKKNFRAFAHEEMARYFKTSFVRAVQDFVPAVRAADITRSEKIGIRAQLINTHTDELVMDYMILTDSHSTHVLNSVSPGFTSSMSFAKMVCDDYLFAGAKRSTKDLAAPMASI